ncbi:MAG: cytochrome c biogenesis protein ResB [Propionibacteriaceae bacterium]|jgi:cytochrome c biogenesis protein|nr:cytochrome c biogenesis protein ResB [Propionibacteriaceae bacterium]
MTERLVDADRPGSPERLDDGDEPQLTIGDFFHRLYQVTYSKTIGLIIILVLAVFVLIGVIIVQAPAGTYADPAQTEQFMSQMRAKYGGWASVFEALGLFHVFTSVAFLVVVVALAISITGCTTHRIPQLWQNFRHPRVKVSDRFFTAARYQATVPTGLNPEQTLQLAEDKLKSQHYRVIKSDGASLYVDKYSWGGFGTVAAHLSFIIILAAFLITGLFGYEAILNVPVGGDGVAVGQGTALSVKATSFNAAYDSNGRPLDYVSHVIVTDGDKVVAEQDVRVNEPITMGKWAFHQDSFGLAVDVAVTDGSGASVFTGSVPQQWTSNDGTLAIGRFRLEDRGVTVDVLAAQSGVTNSELAPGQVAFLIYRDGQTEATDMNTVDQSETVTIGDLDFTFERESQYTGIKVRTDPGTIWMWIGSILLVSGMTVTFTCRHRRVWVKATDSALLLASADKEDSGLRANFDEIVEQANRWYPSVGRSASVTTEADDS